MARSPIAAKERLQSTGFEIDYIEVWNSNLTQQLPGPEGRWLAAVRTKGVRLIDNVRR